MGAHMHRDAALTRTLLIVAALALGPCPARVAAAPAVTVHFGVIAEEPNEPDRMFKLFGPFVACLRERLAPGVAVGELVVARDLDDLSQRLVRHDVDFVLETLFPALTLRERSHDLEPTLLVVRRGQREYKTVFFTRDESPIRRLTDLRGRTLVLQAVRSTTAFGLPRAELLRAGLVLVSPDQEASRSAVRYVLALAEINQAVWVLHGRGDAGAFNEGDWAALPDKIRSQLRIFHETRSIQRGLIAFRDGLDPATRRSLEQVLLGLDEDAVGRAALSRAAGITRFERLTPQELKSVLDWGRVLLPAPVR
jgi:phosphonate transport system substrate-binding protein